MALAPMVRALDRAEVEPLIAILAPTPLPATVLRDDGVRVVELGARGRGRIARFRGLRRLIREHAVQLVHAHGTDAIILGALAGRMAKIPIVASMNEEPTTFGGLHRNSLSEWLMMELLRSPRATTIAVSESVRKAFNEKYSLPPKRIEVVYGGIKAVTYERRNQERSIELKLKLGFPADGRVVVTISPLQAASGVDILLRAMQTVLKTLPEARLLVIGEGPMRQQWTALAKHLGIEAAVKWTGDRDDASALLAGSDLFVHPSREESFPVVLLEAMATELPVLATAVGGTREIIDSPRVGQTVPPRDPPALAREIHRMLGNPDQRHTIAAAGRRRVVEHFPAQRWQSRLTTLYRDAVGELTRPLRIAVVEPAGSGDPIHHAFQLCRAMRDEGADVTLVTEADYELESVVPSFRLLKILRPPRGRGAKGGKGAAREAQPRPDPRLSFPEWLRLIRHLRDERYDAIQIRELAIPGDYVPLRLARRHARVLAAIHHDPVPPRAEGMASALAPRTVDLLDRIFVHSEAGRAAFAAAFPASASRLEVIPHGNQELFRELRAPLITGNRLRTELGFLPGEPVVLAFGPLEPGRGLDLLIEGFASVALGHSGARLVIAGPAAREFSIPQHLALAVSLGAGDRVRIVDSVIGSDSIAAWMELASIMIFPDPEVHGAAGLSLAQTFGVPVIATRAGAAPEVVEEGVSGILVEPRSADALGDAMSRLIEEPELASRIGAASREASQKRSGWNTIARAMLGVLERDFVTSKRI
ncbi:MAG TPA: glycosyltransferase [Thermoanaerobaculia bacterium]|nr:glycosyltransferase [Thermoanaerobaculia bacterium]